jgi:hypothetical protein
MFNKERQRSNVKKQQSGLAAGKSFSGFTVKYEWQSWKLYLRSNLTITLDLTGFGNLSGLRNPWRVVELFSLKLMLNLYSDPNK